LAISKPAKPSLDAVSIMIGIGTAYTFAANFSRSDSKPPLY
jgi:hypothetical protein